MKKAGCGGEGEREQLVNMPKGFRQCSNKPQWKTKVLCQLSSKTISVDSLELLASALMLISPLTFWLTLLSKTIISIDGDGAYGSAFWQASLLLPAMGKHQWSDIWMCYFWLQSQRWKCLVNACLRLPPHGESREWGQVIGLSAISLALWCSHSFYWKELIFKSNSRGKNCRGRNCIGFISYKLISPRTSLCQFFVSFFAWWDLVIVKSAKVETTF